jgi:uncharacterized glyoxalase superfamily protein PhnB
LLKILAIERKSEKMYSLLIWERISRKLACLIHNLAESRIVKEPQETFWSGFSGYFDDLDGHYREVAWGSMFEFAKNGGLGFKKTV